MTLGEHAKAAGEKGDSRNPSPVRGRQRPEGGGEHDADDAALRERDEDGEAAAPVLLARAPQERPELQKPGEALALDGEDGLVGVLGEVDLGRNVRLHQPLGHFRNGHDVLRRRNRAGVDKRIECSERQEAGSNAEGSTQPTQASANEGAGGTLSVLAQGGIACVSLPK